MTKSFDDIVSNYKDPSPEWQVLINGKNYSTNLELLEFTDSVSNPLKFTIKLSGIDSSDNIPEDAEVIVKRAGGELFRGILKQVEPNNLNNYTFKGTGYAAELEAEIERKYESSSVSNIVDDIVGGTSVGSGSLSFSTNYDFTNSPIQVEDFRAKKKQLEEVNRLMGEFNVEWYTTFDGSSPVFNVTNQISFTDGGNPIDTLKTYAPNQSAEMVKQNANRNKGNFDGVVVRGYGDGDDQVTATAGNTSKGNRALIYTDKTIITEAQAQRRADNVLASNSVSWQEIEVEPSNPNKVYGVGQQLKIEAEEARLNDTYRVVEVYFKIFPGEDEFESKLNLSSKPQTFVDDYKQQKEQTESQTDYMQGNRNTINESNAELSNSSEGTTIELNIPERFTRDLTGRDRTAQVRLDFDADDYKQLLSASDVTSIDDSTQVYDTTVTDFGDVEAVQTEGNDRDSGTNSTFADVTKTDTTQAGGATLSEEVASGATTFSSVDDGNWDTAIDIKPGDANTTQGMFVIFNYRHRPQRDGNSSSAEYQNTDIQYRVVNTDTGRIYPSTNGAKILNEDFSPNGLTTWLNSTDQVYIWVPEDVGGQNYQLQVNASPVDFQGTIFGQFYSIQAHKHNLAESSEAAERVTAYTLSSDGSLIGGDLGANQDTDELPDTGTTTFGKLDNNELVLTKKSSTSDQVRVFVNGNELPSSPFTNLGSDNLPQDEDIDLDEGGDINAPGFNEIEVRPEDSSGSTDGKAYLKANAIVDFKLDGERA